MNMFAKIALEDLLQQIKTELDALSTCIHEARWVEYYLHLHNIRRLLGPALRAARDVSHKEHSAILKLSGALSLEEKAVDRICCALLDEQSPIPPHVLN